MTQNNPNPRCKALAKSGKPCRAAATPGGLCFLHANPNKASELGRIGGRSRHPSVLEGADPLPKLETAGAVQEAVGKLFADVHAGKVHPRTAASLRSLMSLQLQAIKATDLERRIAELEKQAVEARRGPGFGWKEDGDENQTRPSSEGKRVR
jgi:hypothetical protein